MWVKWIDFECNKNVPKILGLWVLFWCIRIKNNDFRMLNSVYEFMVFWIKWIWKKKISPNNFMLCDCMVKKFSQKQPVLQIAHWNHFCQVWELCKSPFWQIPSICIQNCTWIWWVLWWLCYVREEPDETIATLLETWIAAKTVWSKSPELFNKE